MKPRPRTAREMLRQSAQCLDAAGLRGHADDLRTIADRFDAEEADTRGKINECVIAKNPSALATWLMIEKLLARLDADLGGTR